MGLGVGARATPGAPSAWSVQWRAALLPWGLTLEHPDSVWCTGSGPSSIQRADAARPAARSHPQEVRSVKVALYARVSSTRQEQDHTIASQVEALEATATVHDDTIASEGGSLTTATVVRGSTDRPWMPSGMPSSSRRSTPS